MGDSGNEGGASKSFFFFTADNKYIVKTISHEEFKTFISLIPKMKNTQRQSSLLAKV